MKNDAFLCLFIKVASDYFCNFVGMETLIRHIEYLLSSHDCVIVPGFGAFLATWQSAYPQHTSKNIEHIAYSYPRRIYTFNSELTDNDGLLYASVARSSGVSSAEAAAKVDKAVGDLKAVLSHDGEAVIGSVGRIEVTMLGELTFEPYKADRLTPLAGWMGEMVAPTPRIESVSSLREPGNSDFIEAARPSRWARVVRSTLGAAAAVLIAIVASTPIVVTDITSPSDDKEVAAYTASTVLNVTPPSPVTICRENVGANATGSNTGSISNLCDSHIESDTSEIKAAVAPSEESKGTPETTTPSISHTTVEEQQPRTIVAKQSNDTQKASSVSRQEPKVSYPAPKASKPAPQPIRFEHNDPYILVVASLASRADAEQFLVDYTFVCDFPLGIQETDGRFRIYAATGSNSNDVMKFASSKSISKHFKNAWVCKRL